jgi:glycosyltransferase involved in cell wall biosynthesis
VIVCFNSWYLYPTAFILSFIPRVRVVVDLGYPISDISTIGLPFNFKRIIGSLDSLLYVRPISILVESKEQKARLQAEYSKPIFYAFHVLNSSGLLLTGKTTHIMRHETDTSQPKYILFRGTLNPESGIITIIEDFIDFKLKYPSCSIKLYVKGSGEFSSFVFNKASESNDIIFINSYLDNESLTKLMVESVAMIGQFGIGDTRLNYTIPHKFIEAIKLRKLYLSPLSLPIEDYYRLLLHSDELELLRQSNRPFSFWLSQLNDLNRIPTSRRINEASKVVEDDLASVNHSSLISCIL